MNKVKTSELNGVQLDWAVAKADGWEPMMDEGGLYFYDFMEEKNWRPSTDWEQGGPIIEREVISIGKHTWDANGVISWGASKSSLFQGAPFSTGQTPLIAAMRCYVASKLGEEVEIPEEVRGNG